MEQELQSKPSVTKLPIWAIALLAICLLGVGYLSFEVFRLKSGAAKVVPDTISPGQLKVAYVDLDSVNAKYNFIVEKTKVLEDDYKKADNEFQREVAKRQKEVDELVTYAQRGNLSKDEEAVTTNRINQLQSELAQIQQQAQERLAASEGKLQEELQKRMDEYTKKYATENGWDYIFAYQHGASTMFFANPAYNITDAVIQGLNEEYAKETGK
jgi:outer membrane protein